MKKIKYVFLLLLIFQISWHSAFAQRYELSINAGSNLTYVPDFDNYIVIANDGILVPGIISPSNSVSPLLISESQSQTNAKAGFSFDLEFGVKLIDKWQLSFATGLNQFVFDYDTYVETEGTQSVYLGNLAKDYGNTKLLYLNLNPSNICLDLFNKRLEIQCGPTFNFLLKSKYNNALVLYASEQVGEATVEKVDKVYFESIGEMKKILFGLHFRTAFNIISRFDIFISGQNYFNSIYSENDFGYLALTSTKPFQIQAGVRYVIWNSGNSE